MRILAERKKEQGEKNEETKCRKETERRKPYLHFSFADDKGKIIIITQTIISLSCAPSQKSHP